MQESIPEYFDNKNRRVVDDLKKQLSSSPKVAIAAASFSIYAFEALKDELENVEELRFIFTSPTFIREKQKKEKREFYIPKLNRERNLYGSEFEIKLRNQLSQKAIAKECADWIRRKAHFKSNISDELVPGMLNLENSSSEKAAREGSLSNFCYYPFNDFTTTDLGLAKGKNMFSAINRFPSPMAEFYLRTFDELWKDQTKFTDVTDRVLEYMETVYNENAPEYIYFITLYHIFNEFLEDISEDVLPNENVGFNNSVIWQKLFNFQRDAALACINKLEKYHGCILADSVGLGKTFTALAVIKYYELRNKSVLVLCPKKLNENWITYKANYTNNPIAADRLNYDVFFHSDLTRDKGQTNGMDLERVNWSNYDLLVIDESHNFRNGGNIDEEDDADDFMADDDGSDGNKKKENRYQRLMNRIIRGGATTKVLMLSATPVNNRFNDLKNQLQLAYEGRSDDFNSLLGEGKNIDDIFKNAQKAYNRWSKLPNKARTTERLQDELSFDFFELLDDVTIARSRSHIVKYYDTQDIGNFPTRLAPISRRPKLTDLSTNKSLNFTDISEMLNQLNLAIYTPSYYIYESKKENYDLIVEGTNGLSINGREKGIRNLMATNLLKRLESSVNSFRLTLTRIEGNIKEMIEKIDAFEEQTAIYEGMAAEDRHSSKNADCISIEAFPDEIDSSEGDIDFSIGKNSHIHLCDMDFRRWRRALKDDLEILRLLLMMLKDITPEHDSKLQMLISDLKEKFAHPINLGNKKVLIFTAFADTAEYLYKQLAEKIKADTGMNVALITGNTEGKCTIPNFPMSFNNILTYFSPISKDKAHLPHPLDEDIDVLIATDCISEGQNLQDCDYLINYDIHWNPVRIIQRFGRIDRIGSKNSVIQLVNYWPDMELDQYIELKGRVESRMKATVLTSTGNENILLPPDEKDDLEYRKQQLQKLQHEVVDIEDMDTGINIMDLGLNEFRLDLLAYIKDNPDVEHAPCGMDAVVGHSAMAKPGVIYILKNRSNEVNIDQKNLLHPFYMVYISEDGEVICDHLHPKKLLDTMRHLCRGKAEPDKELCNLLNHETKDGKKMDKYSDLLHQAIDSIISVKEESDIDSLFSLGETSALRGEIKGLDDFELITFLVVK